MLNGLRSEASASLTIGRLMSDGKRDSNGSYRSSGIGSHVNEYQLQSINKQGHQSIKETEGKRQSTMTHDSFN